jgi:hypothetical protein
VPDPYRTLGLRPDASLAEVRAARRALVKALHPDLRGTDQPDVRAAAEHRLAEVNAAFDEVVAARVVVAAATDPGAPPPAGNGAPGPHHRETDLGASLVIGAFRPDAFEGLVLAAGDLGDVTDTDEPFNLEVFVEGPPTGFCRIELFPEAGATVVVLDSEQVDVAAVGQVLVAALRRLGFSAEVLAP